MFAVVKTGGKQYKVSPGDVLIVERLDGVSGDEVVFQDVVLCQTEKETHIGSPLVEKASVKATIREQDRGEKIIVFKKKRRKGYKRKAGHRQLCTVLDVSEILFEGKSVAKSTQEDQDRAEKYRGRAQERHARDNTRMVSWNRPTTDKTSSTDKKKTLEVEKTEKAPSKKKASASEKAPKTTGDLKPKAPKKTSAKAASTETEKKTADAEKKETKAVKKTGAKKEAAPTLEKKKASPSSEKKTGVKKAKTPKES